MPYVDGILSMREWQSETVENIDLCDSDRLLLDRMRDAEPRLEVIELRNGIRVTTFEWVGVVRFRDFELRVMPKLVGDSFDLVRMIEVASGIDALRRLSGRAGLTTGDDYRLLDLLALLLVTQCERIVTAGLLHDYVECEDVIETIRGRFLADRQVLRRAGRLDRLECRFDDHSSDVLENQILTTALTLCRSRVDHPSILRRVHRMYDIFAEASTALGGDFKAARSALTYNRLNRHYESSHELAWLIIHASGVDDLLQAGSVDSYAFLLDMNTLWERFVWRSLERSLPHDRYRIHYQHRLGGAIWDVTRNRAYASLVPDIIVEPLDGSAWLAVDAKYKRYDQYKVGTDDVYQVFTYAQALAVEDIPARCVIIYPSSSDTASSVRLSVRRASQQAMATVDVIGWAVREDSALANAWLGV